MVTVRKVQSALLCFLIALCIYYSFEKEHRAPVPDGYVYYAYTLSEWGQYANAATATTEPEPGIGRAPLYPMFLALAMELSPAYKNMALCHIKRLSNCSWHDARIVHVLQLIMLAGCLLLLVWAGVVVGAPPWAAGHASIVVAPELMKLAFEYRMSEGLAVPLFAITTFGLIAWVAANGRYRYLVLAGVALGLLSLTRSAFVYFIPVMSLVLLLAPTRRTSALDQGVKLQWVASAIFLASSVAIVAPWYLRNLTYFDRLVIGEAGFEGVMVMRIAHNDMDLSEASAAFFVWGPRPIKKLAPLFYSSQVLDRFRLDKASSFRQQGWDLLRESKVDFPGKRARRSFLLKKMLLEDPLRHALVSVPLMWRGLRYNLFVLPFALIALIGLARQRQWWFVGGIAFTALAIAFHAGLTNFRSRYGIPLLFGFAPFAAYGFAIVAQFFLRPSASKP